MGIEHDVMPECMMPDGGHACSGYAELVQEVQRLRAEVKELRTALVPFAAFNDALKEWRFGPSKYLLQPKRLDHLPFLRWVEPTPPPGVPGKLKMEVRVLEVWPQDFERAEKVMDSGKQEPNND